MHKRFRGFYPVVIDVETGGFDAKEDALLELAAIFIQQDPETKHYLPVKELHWHITPFEGSRLHPQALAFNKIDPTHPFRFAVTETVALSELMGAVKTTLKETLCQRAILVGHNAWFDLSFLNAAFLRTGLKKNFFHSFSSLDTASLGAVFLGHTVLATLIKRAGLSYNANQAHGALYDAKCTAELFCWFLNKWDSLTQGVYAHELTE